jgi:hypothetical protein
MGWFTFWAIVFTNSSGHSAGQAFCEASCQKNEKFKIVHINQRGDAEMKSGA